MKYLRKFNSVEERTAALSIAGINILSYTTGTGMDIHIPNPPTNLTISCSNNTVTITATNATTLEYNTDGSSTYTTYTQPFAISQTVTVYAKATNSDGSITGSQVCEYVKPIDYTIPFYVEDISGSSNMLSIKKRASNAPTLTIEKSLDGETWETMGSTSTNAIYATIPANGRVYLRCVATKWCRDSNNSNRNAIVASSNYKMGGNIMSLAYGDSFNGQTEFDSNMTQYVFSGIFQNCTSKADTSNTTLIDASELLLPATTLTDYCYRYMFSGCTSLTATPVLPATTLASGCYYMMFAECPLTTAPALPATTLASGCYQYMFGWCTSLTIAPALPATTLAQHCYEYMFTNCSALTTAPALPATTLADSCYNYMFRYCTSLTSAPALQATTLTNACYAYMFQGCTALSTAPVLPATTLADYCYQYMFNGCTSLTTAPELPATTLADYCYQHMFQNCTNINYIKCLATDISAYSCTYNWVSGVAATGTFVKDLSMESWTTGTAGIPEGWTVEDATA